MAEQNKPNGRGVRRERQATGTDRPSEHQGYDQQQRQERLLALRTKIQSGSYEVSAEKVAATLLSAVPDLLKRP